MSQSYSLPTGGFKRLTPTEIASLDYSYSVPDESDTGYIFCKWIWSILKKLRNKHHNFPLAVTEDMLSPYLKSLNNKRWTPTEKLIPNLMDKKDYVVHYRNLEFYVREGLKARAVKNVLSARRPRASSRPTWPSSWLSRLAVFGKSMEPLQNRKSLPLVVEPNKLLRAVSIPSLATSEIINDHLTKVSLYRLWKAEQCSSWHASAPAAS